MSHKIGTSLRRKPHSANMTTLNEADVEQVALGWLNQIGWAVTHGREIAPDTPGAARSDNGQVVLKQWLRDALLNIAKGVLR